MLVQGSNLSIDYGKSSQLKDGNAVQIIGQMVGVSRELPTF